MQNLLPLFLLFLLHASSSRYVDPENFPQLDTATRNFHDELSKLKETMTALNSLSDTQKQLLESQRINEERMRAQHKEEEEREAVRSVTLTADHKLLEEIRGKVYRKINYLSKNTTQGEDIQVNRPKDCGDIYVGGNEKSGKYRVWPLWNRDRKSYAVNCDMDTDGGGWTVIHMWKHDEVPKKFFQRTWREYKHGFGDLQAAFWLGNELIYELTRHGGYELRLDFENENGKKHSVYDSFFIADEEDHYKLHLGNYLTNGTAGNIIEISDGKNFTTQDRNNLPLGERTIYKPGKIYPTTEYYQSDCAKTQVGWWYGSSCEIDSQIHPLTATQTQMMIRQKWFFLRKESPP